MRIITIILLLIVNTAFGQDKIDYSEDWKQSILSNEKLSDDTFFTNLIYKSDFTSCFLYDDNLKYRNDHHGIFGDDNIRIDFIFTKVYKDFENPLLYHIRGKTRKEGKLNDFSGYVNLSIIKKEYDFSYYSIYFETNDTTFYNVYSGYVIGKYQFTEDSIKNGNGVYSGIFGAIAYFDSKDNFKPLFMGEFEEGRFAGSFVGIWHDIESKKIEKSVWNYGPFLDFPCTNEFWIPITEREIKKHKRHHKCNCIIDFDSLKKLNPKYIKNGWRNFREYEKDWW